MTARKGLFHGTGGIPFRGELAGQETAETKSNLIFLKSTNWSDPDRRGSESQHWPEGGSTGAVKHWTGFTWAVTLSGGRWNVLKSLDWKQRCMAQDSKVRSQEMRKGKGCCLLSLT